MSKKVKIILTLACVTMAFIGVIVFLVMSNSNNQLLEHTTITLKGETTETLTAEITDLYPGSVKQYEITLKGDHPEEFYISLTFREKADSALKGYIGVKIITDNCTVEKSLKELLDGGEKIVLGNNTTKIKIIYTMSIDAGNDTQGKDISFYVDLSAKRTAE